MFTLKLGGWLDRYMRECNAWRDASAEEKADGCLFLRSLVIASLKHLGGIFLILLMIVVVWGAFWIIGEFFTSLWLHFVCGMDKEQIDTYVAEHRVWFWFAPHIVAAVWSVIYQRLKAWYYRAREKRLRAKFLQEDLDKFIAPPKAPRQPNKILILIKALAGKACFKVNVVE